MKIVVAVSGGLDSVALLHLLARGKLAEFLKIENRKSKIENRKLIVAHFDHRIHGESRAHAQFVEKLAAKYRLPFFGGKSRRKLKSEADARDARFEFLEKVAAREKCDRIALAHHADDQVETIFLNIVRGSGLRGLGGMSEFAGKKWRPLLGVSKSELAKFAAREKLKFVDDPTNAESNYSRNFLRREILPKLRKLNPKMDAAILRLARQSRENLELANEVAAEFLARTADGKSLPLAQFTALPPAVAKSVIREIYFREVGNLRKIESLHLDEILELARNPAGGKRKKFGELIFRTGKEGDNRILSWK